MRPLRTARALRPALFAALVAGLAMPAAADDLYGWGGKERKVRTQSAGSTRATRGAGGKGRQCASVGKVRAATAITDSDLVLHDGPDHVWISHLPERCDGLKSINNLGRIKLPKQARVCTGDHFEIWAPGDDAPTRCTFGPFEGGSEMLVPELLRR